MRKCIPRFVDLSDSKTNVVMNEKRFSLTSSFMATFSIVALNRCNLVLMVLLALAAKPLSAQRNEKIITLSENEKALPFKTGTPISNIQVIQAMPDSNTLGYVQKGLGNRLVLAGPKTTITEDLQTYLHTQYRQQLQSQGAAVLIVVKDIRINERTFAMKERAYIHFLADSWISTNNDNRYVYATTLDTIFKTGGMDVTAGHGKNIARCFHTLINKTATIVTNTPATTQSTYEEVKARAYKRFEQPILQEANYKPGLYTTYDEFLQNNPSVLTYQTSTTKKEGLQFKILLEDGSEKQITPWGLSKNGELYVYHDKNLVPIERKENNFIISTYVEVRKRRNQAMLIGAIAGGMTGAIIASASGMGTYIYIPVSGQSSGTLLTNIPQLAKEQPEPSHLDFETGKLYF